jgi:anti-sigma factor RsiW
MSCGRTAKLEALVAGELPVAPARELRAHAAACSRCRHELNWLESEQALFRQRAGREEVAHLWAGVVTRSGGKTAPRAWGRVLVAVAASLLVLLAGGRLVVSNASHPGAPAQADVPAEALQSVLAQSFDVDERCSLGGPGSPGFHCAAPLPASLLASR